MDYNLVDHVLLVVIAVRLGEPILDGATLAKKQIHEICWAGVFRLRSHIFSGLAFSKRRC